MTQCSLDGYPGLLEKHPLLIAGILHRDFGRGRPGAAVTPPQLLEVREPQAGFLPKDDTLSREAAMAAVRQAPRLAEGRA